MVFVEKTMVLAFLDHTDKVPDHILYEFKIIFQKDSKNAKIRNKKLVNVYIVFLQPLVALTS